MNKKLTCIAMIPARLDSVRFPGKLMKDLEGKTIIRRTYEATVATDLFDAVYVVTDHKKIYEEIDSHGGNALYYNTQHDNGSERIAEAAKDIGADIVVNVQGDEPFTSKTLLENLLSVFTGEQAESIDLATPMIALKDQVDIENPNNVKVITDVHDFALYFSRSVIPYPRSKSEAPKYY